MPLVLDPAEVLETISKDDIKLKHNAEAMLEIVEKGQVKDLDMDLGQRPNLSKLVDWLAID